ncbi:hypothetical protein GGR35_002415 [Mucilaginibacter phyllosphaerae]|uniref:Uncharacterized protein n=1 Tax=Mucilaginibacter phyllosphaerae TaxID=1812349 RepID=A0ABR6IA08_9SPHI|nr:hypothetical protein [Mucilaginibacter phyllosphaerae]
MGYPHCVITCHQALYTGCLRINMVVVFIIYQPALIGAYLTLLYSLRYTKMCFRYNKALLREFIYNSTIYLLNLSLFYFYTISNVLRHGYCLIITEII